jgi:hypothetical protein
MCDWIIVGVNQLPCWRDTRAGRPGGTIVNCPIIDPHDRICSEHRAHRCHVVCRTGAHAAAPEKAGEVALRIEARDAAPGDSSTSVPPKRFGSSVRVGDVVKGAAGAAGNTSFSNSSTACRNDTPSAFITQWIAEPPAWQAPKQCHRFLAGVITSDGVRSSWNGQRPCRSAPCFVNITPRASARRCTDTSVFSRSITPSGMRAMPYVPFSCRVSDVAPRTVPGIEHRPAATPPCTKAVKPPAPHFSCLKIMTAYCTIFGHHKPCTSFVQPSCTRTGYTFP